MKRYFREVRMLDKGEISIEEFIRRVVSVEEKITDVDIAVAYRIYVEDGGRRYGFEDFAKCIEEKTLPVELDVVKGIVTQPW